MRNHLLVALFCLPVLNAQPIIPALNPSIDASQYRITTFATGLSFPYGMHRMADGALIVGVAADPTKHFHNSPGRLLRLTDDDNDGIADSAGVVVADNLVPSITAVRGLGPLVVVATSGRNDGSHAILFFRPGVQPTDPWTMLGKVDVDYQGDWWHDNLTLAVRPSPTQIGLFEIFFHTGSEFNDGASVHNITLSGLMSATLIPESIYSLTIDPAITPPTLSNLTRIATGIRNAAGMAFHPVSGDLYFSDNAPSAGGSSKSADELNVLAAADIGGAVENFGFPTGYVTYRTGVVVGGGIQPVAAFQPIPDPLTGNQSLGPTEIAFPPADFPAPHNSGVFCAFHGVFTSGGVANTNNPLVFANPANGQYEHFIRGGQPGIGHLNSLLSTTAGLFVAEFSDSGLLSIGNGGSIYLIARAQGGSTGGALTSLVLGAPSVTGGLSVVSNRPALGAPAPAGGAVVQLSSSHQLTVPVPSTVTVPEGATTVFFNMATNPVAAALTVTITATRNGIIRTATIRIDPPVLVSLGLSPVTLFGGVNSTGNSVTLTGKAPTGGAAVSMQSSNPSLAAPPASVVVPGGSSSTTFPITTSGVAAVSTATVTAAFGGVTKTANLTLNPAALASVSLSPASLAGGASSTANRVNLNGKAPPGGLVVPVTSSNTNAATVPSTVNIPEGATNATFPITTLPVDAITTVSVSAQHLGVTKSVTLTVNPVILLSVTLSPVSAIGGTLTTGNRVNLSGPAPPGGAVVTMTSSNPGVAPVPANLTIAAGATLAAFSVPTTPVASNTSAVIEVSYGGLTRSATLNVVAASLTSFYTAAATTTGGTTAGNRVNLNGKAPAGGAVVALVSSNPDVASVAPSVTVPPGSTSTSLSITTAIVTAPSLVTITATYAGVSRQLALTVLPAALTSVTVSPASTVGGLITTANRVTLTGKAAASGATVALVSSDPGAANVAASVTIPSGATFVTFPATIAVVTSQTSATITATYAGLTRQVNLTILPPALASVTLSPATTPGGAVTSAHRVNLTGKAPPAGMAVNLSSANPSLASVPTSVTVPAGATFATFTITSTAVAATTPIAITATSAGVTRSATFTLTPPALSSVTVSPTSTKGGTTTTASRVTLATKAPAGGAPVSLSSSAPTTASVPATATVPEGATFVTFSIVTTAVGQNTPVTITATRNGVVRTATLTVIP